MGARPRSWLAEWSCGRLAWLQEELRLFIRAWLGWPTVISCQDLHVCMSVDHVSQPYRGPTFFRIAYLYARTFVF